MEDQEREKANSFLSKWEITLLFIVILFTVVLSLVGWYMDGSVPLPR